MLIVQRQAESRITSCLDRRWHFESRIKEEESYALKIDSGRYYGNCCIEDMYACTIVVRNVSEISDAERSIESLFTIDERRPPNDSLTGKRAAEFRFDDLRLYCFLMPREFENRGPIHDVKFEVQIKTFLQHAWAIATHDMVYKSNTISWPMRRIAYQIKAMLEHAEVSIIEAEKLSGSPCIAKEDKETEKLRFMIENIICLWPKEKLPADVVRLSEISCNFLSLLKIEHEDFLRALMQASANGNGVNVENLSPYGVVVQTACDFFPNHVESVWRDKRIRKNIVIPPGVVLPASLGRPVSSKIIIL